MAATAQAPSAEAGGMPQLDFASFPNQIFWLVVALVVIYLIVTYIALPRIASVLALRQSTISGDLARAEELKRSAVEAEAAYEKALSDARTQAQAIIADTRAKIQHDLDVSIEKADAEIAVKVAESEKKIASIRAVALKSVEEISRNTAQAIIEKISPSSVDPARLTAEISEQLKG